jgi:hypothetical protein
MLAGIEELSRDPRRYIRGLIKKLEADKINDVPEKIWITVAAGPEVIYPPPPEPEDDGSYGWFTIVAVLLAIILVGGCVAAIVRKRRELKSIGKKVNGSKYKDSPSSPPPASKEAWNSESPKRTGKTYRKKAPGAVEPEPTPEAAESPKGGWMGKLFSRSKSGASPEPANVPSFDPADPSELLPGTEVRLFGLSKIEYNGLKGVVRGPAEKEGRFVIDVILFDSATMQETQELSLKADNLRLIPQTARSP